MLELAASRIFEEQNANAFLIPGHKRETERALEISGKKLVSVPGSSFLFNHVL